MSRKIKSSPNSKMIKSVIIPIVSAAICTTLGYFIVDVFFPNLNKSPVGAYTRSYEHVEENVKDIVFDENGGNHKIIIETNDATTVRDKARVTFKRSEKEYNYVAYKENKNKRDVKTDYIIYLTDNDIKKYSKEYALIFKETLGIKEN